MKIKRRDFLKAAAGSGLLLAAGTGPAPARGAKVDLPPKAVGMLLDSTLCVGCQVCVGACKRANNMPMEHAPGTPALWNNPRDLSAKTLNIIKKYDSGSGLVKSGEENGYAFIKRHCMHCLNPACVSACPVSALTKSADSGVVSYNVDACIGCRYCQVACPFNIPKFEWDAAFPRIYKCQMCDHLLKKGDIAACCASCPTGASLFGPLEDLYAEAKRRLAMEPGKPHAFPVADIRGRERQQHQAAQYIQHIYGQNELGGTQVLMLAGVPFAKLGLPGLPEESFVDLANGIQYAIYKGLVYPIVVLGGLIYLVQKGGKGKE